MSTRCTVHDITTISKREVTPQGYLVAPAIIGRTGVQTYTRGELELDGDPLALVRLMRTADEVFRPETVASFENVPITDGHPSGGVNAQNWAKLSKGEVRNVSKQPGDLLGAAAIIKDGGIVSKVVGGKGALSCGYSFNLDLTPGEGFDGYQREILGDHVAIVDVPRGGPVCRIADRGNQTEEQITMSTRKIAVDGLPRFEIDELAAEAIETHVKKLAADRDQVIADFSEAVDTHKAKISAKDAELTAVKASVTAKDTEITALKAKLAKVEAIDIDTLVADRAALVESAKKLAPELDIKGSSHDIRKAAIAVACGDATNKAVADELFGAAGIDKATEEQVKATFGVLLSLPRQAALAAQDAAIRALGGNSNLGGVTGPVERL